MAQGESKRAGLLRPVWAASAGWSLAGSTRGSRALAHQGSMGMGEHLPRNSAGRGQGVRREVFMGQSKIRALGQGGSLAPALFLLRLASGSVNRTFVARLHSQVLCQEFGYVCCKL